MSAPTHIRKSAPELNVSKFKNVLLYLSEQCAGKPNVGERVMNKLLYFCDFNYYEMYEEHLTGAQYVKRQYGPVPLKIESIVSEMQRDRLIKIINTDYYGHPQKRYIPLVRPDLKHLSAAEMEVINRVVAQLGCLSATGISDYSHNDMPYVASQEGEVIQYNLVLYREAPYSVSTYNNE
jgi:uncharacterized phage-associated protein